MKPLLRVLAVLILPLMAGSVLAQTEAPPDGEPAPPETGAALGEPRTEAAEPAAPRPEDAPSLPSFQRGSGQRAGGPASELNTGDRRATEALPGGSAADALTGRDLYHGNYCGHGQRGSGLAPTDELDAACNRHDACYEAAGRRSCACDAALRREALALSNTANLSRALRARAASVAEAAELMACEPP